MSTAAWLIHRQSLTVGGVPPLDGAEQTASGSGRVEVVVCAAPGDAVSASANDVTTKNDAASIWDSSSRNRMTKGIRGWGQTPDGSRFRRSTGNRSPVGMLPVHHCPYAVSYPSMHMSSLGPRRGGRLLRRPHHRRNGRKPGQPVQFGEESTVEAHAIPDRAGDQREFGDIPLHEPVEIRIGDLFA